MKNKTGLMWVLYTDIMKFRDLLVYECGTYGNRLEAKLFAVQMIERIWLWKRKEETIIISRSE